MKPGLFFAVIVATFVVGFAVGRVSAPPNTTATAPTAMAAAPAPTPVSPPPPGPALADTSGGAVAGTVAEVIQVPNYTYLRLSTGAGETWAAVSSTQAVAVGQAVRVVSANEMTGFASKTLNRTFDSIWFGQLELAAGAPTPSASPDGLPPGHPSVAPPPVGGAAAGALAALDQAGPALALRVSDVFAEKAALGGKRVRLKGTATRVTSVQGTFYVHLKDGSGTPGQDDDLTVLTTTEVKVDQPVTVEGRVALNKDVGMGAPYPVVLEGATVVGN